MLAMDLLYHFRRELCTSGATLLDQFQAPIAMPGEDVMEELDVWTTCGEEGIDVTDGLLEGLEALLFEDDGGCFDVAVVHGASQSRVAFTLLIVMVRVSMSWGSVLVAMIRSSSARRFRRNSTGRVLRESLVSSDARTSLGIFMITTPGCGGWRTASRGDRGGAHPCG